MFITKSDSSRSSACTVDVHAATEDVVKREDPRSNGRSDIVYHDVKGDGCYPANSSRYAYDRVAHGASMFRHRKGKPRLLDILSRATKSY